jgi:iron complex outermembrane receptor protein
MRWTKILAAWGLLALSCLSFPTVAQQTSTEAQPSSSAPGNVLEEVVVSAARKRTEDVQSTPLAVTAINADMLQRANVTNLTEIGQLAPNLEMERTYSTADAVTIYLRGFGVRTNDPSNDPHVATFIDGIYQPHVSGTLIDMFDISTQFAGQ